MTLTDWLENSLERNSDFEAIRMNGESLIYSHLNHASANFALELKKLGATEGSRIAIHLEKSLEAVVAILAALRLGAAYVPIDTNLPVQRKCKLLTLIDPIIIVEGRKKIADFNGGQRISFFRKDIDPTPRAAPLRDEKIAVKTAAYILFTSGSTGNPKAVEISQAAALAFTSWAADFFNLSRTDSIAACSGFHFDLSTFDLFSSLGSGSKVVLMRDGLAGFPSELAKFLDKEKISVLYSVPSTISLLAEFSIGDVRKWPNLRLVISAGDAFPTKAAQKIHAGSQTKIFNLYGPTETNVCTAWEYDGRDYTLPVPIGSPVAGALCAVLDESLNPVPSGETGELYVSGPTLMTGYLNDRDATGQALVSTPQTGLYYRTGDIAFRDDSGLFYFVGRRDSQLKSCGYRIHPLEIESALKLHDGVLDAAVIGVPDTRLGNRLIAFLETNGKTSETALFDSLRRELPAYMIPEEIRFLDRLPRNTNGKIDRDLLKKEIKSR